MRCYENCFWLLTCGIGPWLQQKCKEKTKYNDWELKKQIMLGVGLSLIGVQIIFCAVMIVFLSFLFRNASIKLTDALTQQIVENYNAQAQNCIGQLAQLQKITSWNIQKNKAVIAEILKPKYFSFYPIDWNKTQIYKFADPLADMKITGAITYDTVTYRETYQSSLQ